MFIEFSRRKMVVLAFVAAALAISLTVFFSVSGAVNSIEQINADISMAISDLQYFLLYRESLASVAYSQGSEAPGGYARSIPVLLYHGEGSNSNMPVSVFVDQMRALHDAGWRTITMEQFDEWMRGQIQLPAKSFLLTFDDGRKDTYYEADPVLKDMGFNAVMFVITGFSLPQNGKGISPNFYLNETELYDMAASGRWELESHGDEDHGLYTVQSTTDLSRSASTTLGHFMSNKFWDTASNAFETDAQFTARVTNDLLQSKQVLETDFGKPVIAYAYPFNDFGQDTVNFPGSRAILDQVIPQIYSYAFYQSWPANGDTFNYPLANNGPNGPTPRPYMEKRIEPNASWNGAELLAILQNGEAKPLPYRNSAFWSEWVDTWGSAVQGAGGLALSALPDTTGADAFLNGSGWWTDYTFFATVDWQQATNVTLIARNSDDKHYVNCAFAPGETVIEEHDGIGSMTTLARKSATLVLGPAVQLSITVSGDTISCAENGQTVVSATAPTMQAKGGAGIEVWMSQQGVAHAIVTSASAVSAAPAAAPKTARAANTASAYVSSGP